LDFADFLSSFCLFYCVICGFFRSFGITAMELAYGRAPYAKFQPMKVMLLTLQEDPPTFEIYGDESYKFNKHLESLVSKCLRKDPSKRPSAKKLLEHKFFKLARDAEYIVEKIVNKLPKPAANTSKISVKSKKDGGKGQKAPVEVGQWVFEEDELQTIKKVAQEQKCKGSSPGQGVDDDDSDYASPINSNPTSPQQINPFSNNNNNNNNNNSNNIDILTAFDPLSPDNTSNNNSSSNNIDSSKSSTSHARTSSTTTTTTTTSTSGRFQVADIVVVQDNPLTSPTTANQPNPLEIDLLSSSFTHQLSSTCNSSTGTGGGSVFTANTTTPQPSQIGRFSVTDSQQ
jgi:serine/threonine protein kinase